VLSGLGGIPAGAQTPPGDFKNIGVYRQYDPNTLSAWWVDSNGNNTYDSSDAIHWFGLYGDIPILGDWKGIQHLQMGIYRQGLWAMDWNDDHYWDAGDEAFSWGWAGDIPVVGDWTHTGKLQVGVVRNSNGFLYWYVNTSPECGSSTPQGCDYNYTATYHPANIQVLPRTKSASRKSTLSFRPIRLPEIGRCFLTEGPARMAPACAAESQSPARM
jgi:hypothetical protein